MEDTLERVEQMQDEFTKLLYFAICRSIYDKHKIIFSFFIAIQLFREEINEQVLKFFLTGMCDIEVDTSQVPIEIDKPVPLLQLF